MAKFDPDVRPNPEAEKARRKAMAAIRVVARQMGEAATAIWLRERAEALARLDIAHTKIDGLLERRADSEARMMQRLEREQRRYDEWRRQTRHLRGEED
jgi:hypothetical protein